MMWFYHCCRQRKGPFCKQNSPSQKLSLKSANITSQLLSQRLQQVQQQQRLQQVQQQRQQQEQLQLQQLQRLLQLRQQLQQELLWLLLFPCSSSVFSIPLRSI